MALLQSPLLLVLLLFGILIIVSGILVVVLPSRVSSRLDKYIGDDAEKAASAAGSRIDLAGELRGKLNTGLSALASDAIKFKIANAHWKISDTEFILIRFAITVAGVFIGWLISKNIFAGLALAVLLYFVPDFMLTRSLDKRRKKFQDQLLDSLILIRGAVQSGYSLLQALELIKSKIAEPASDEYGRVLREVQIGISLNQALQNLADRMASDDLNMVVTSIIVNSEVGGNLTTMLDAVTNTIRARIFLFGEIRAITSYARFASFFMSLLPVFTGLIIFLFSPNYFEPVRESIIPQAILGMAVVSVLIGNFILRRMIKIKY